MIKSNIKKEFDCDKNKLWDIITDNANFTWRSDLSKIVIVDEKHFIEYTKNNFPTYFTITSKIKLKEYKFDLENNNLKEFVEKFGVTDTTEIPDTIDLFSAFTNQETINFTDEEREQLNNTYSSILQEKLGGKEFTKTKENVVTIDNIIIPISEIISITKKY